MFLSEGLGHAFMALSEQATVLYLCSTPYAPGREHGVDPLDPDIGIDWPRGRQADPVGQGRRGPVPAHRGRTAGCCPDYGACLAYAAQLRGPLPAH